MKYSFFSSLLFITLFSAAQTFPVKGERVWIKECGNYSIAPAEKTSDPFSKVKSQLVKQIGAAEYSQLVKRGMTSLWPVSIRNAFNCENVEERNRLQMYKIATYKTGNHHGAIVRIPYNENKNWKPGVIWNGNLYLDIPEADLMSRPEPLVQSGPYQQRMERLDNDVESYLYTPVAGDKLRYEVRMPDGAVYDFVVTIKTFIHSNEDQYPDARFPVAFHWQMGNPVNTSGEVYLSRQALEEAIHYHNYFRNGEIAELKEASTVFLSRKNWYEPGMNDDRSTLMNMTGTEMKFYKPLENAGYLPVKRQGKTYQIPVYRYNNSKDGTGNYNVYVQDEADVLLILKMKLDFEIELKEIIPGRE
jgi:hypothetical protein